MSDRPAYERRDIRAFAVTGTGIGVLFGTLLTIFLIWFLFTYFRHTHAQLAPRPALAPEFSRITQPVLQAAPRRDLQALRARDNRILNGYTWTDKSRGAVSIPIDKAIDKLVTQGMPAAADYSDLGLFPPRSGSRQTGF